MSQHQFNADYKADMNLNVQMTKKMMEFEKEVLAKTFQDVISWCINNETEKLKEAINKRPFRDVILYLI